MGDTENPSRSWFRDCRKCSRLPKPIFIFGDTRKPQLNQEKSNSCWKYCSGEIKNLGNWLLEMWGKAGTDKSGRSVLKCVGNLEYGINVLQKTPNANLVVWDQYLQNNLNWFIASLKLWSQATKKYKKQQSRNHAAMKPRSFETNKPINFDTCSF